MPWQRVSASPLIWRYLRDKTELFRVEVSNGLSHVLGVHATELKAEQRTTAYFLSLYCLKDLHLSWWVGDKTLPRTQSLCTGATLHLDSKVAGGTLWLRAGVRYDDHSDWGHLAPLVDLLSCLPPVQHQTSELGSYTTILELPEGNYPLRVETVKVRHRRPPFPWSCWRWRVTCTFPAAIPCGPPSIILPLTGEAPTDVRVLCRLRELILDERVTEARSPQRLIRLATAPTTDAVVLDALADLVHLAPLVAENPNTSLATLRRLWRGHAAQVRRNPVFPLIMLEVVSEQGLREYKYNGC